MLGVVLVLLIERLPPSRYARAFLAVGIIGAYTTFSTFAAEAAQLAANHYPPIGGGFVIISVAGGSPQRCSESSPAEPSLTAIRQRPDTQRGTDVNIDGDQQRITIFIGESDRHDRKPLATEIVPFSPCRRHRRR